MTALILAITFTLGVSAFCSLLEAFILSSTVAEIESFKKRHRRSGAMLERFRHRIEETSSAILTLNTIANTAGMAWVGALTQVYYPELVTYVAAGMVGAILILSEIIPKNLGVIYRKQLQLPLVYPLWGVRTVMTPFSWAARRLIKTIARPVAPTHEEQEEEIRLLAERSAKTGALTDSERILVSNALSLDDIKVSELMTPRTVVMFLQEETTVEEVLRDFPNIPFARVPVYTDSYDQISGVVRRRDILQAISDERGGLTMADLKNDALYMPETATALSALQLFIKNHQQLAVVVDEFGSTAGVISVEDIIEHLIGDEIYEESDVAVDMRALAASRAQRLPAAAAPMPATTLPKA